MKKILIVDDARDVHMLLNEIFDGELLVTSAYDLMQARQFLKEQKFDLILLDVNLPDGDGFEFCAEMQQYPPSPPVIFLTGKSDLAAKSVGFSLGAEDYIAKPFHALEVKLRCLARLKKYHINDTKKAQHQIGDLRFDIPSLRVFQKTQDKEEALDLTPTGFKILLYMAQHPDQVFTRDQLISAVWGQNTYLVDRTVDTHISTLRKQLNRSNVSIKAVHGTGYKLLCSSVVRSSSKIGA